MRQTSLVPCLFFACLLFAFLLISPPVLAEAPEGYLYSGVLDWITLTNWMRNVAVTTSCFSNKFTSKTLKCNAKAIRIDQVAY
jgi:hypothetical protein